MEAYMLRIIFLVCVLELVISYTFKESEIKADYPECNRTYTMIHREKISLSYYNKHNYFDDQDVSKDVCYLHIVSYERDVSICIKQYGSSSLNRLYLKPCDKLFRYFIGHLPSHLQNGYTCSDFTSGPKCTDRNDVYAVFNNVDDNLFWSAKVEIYTKGKYDTTTTKKPTTPYWYSSNNNYNNDDDDYDNEHSNSMDTTTVIKVVLAIATIASILFGCCACSKSKQTSTTAANGGFNQQSVPRPDYNSLNQQNYSESAPSYDIVMRQPRTQIDADGNTWHVHEPAYEGGGRLGPTGTPIQPVVTTSMTTPTVAATSFIEPTAPETPPITINPPRNNDQPALNDRSDIPFVNQALPSVPPPSYEDLNFTSPPPPPPYKGL